MLTYSHRFRWSIEKDEDNFKMKVCLLSFPSFHLSASLDLCVSFFLLCCNSECALLKYTAYAFNLFDFQYVPYKIILSSECIQNCTRYVAHALLLLLTVLIKSCVSMTHSAFFSVVSFFKKTTASFPLWSFVIVLTCVKPIVTSKTFFSANIRIYVCFRYQVQL